MVESKPRSGHPDSVGQAFLWAVLPTLLLVLTPPNATYAQVTTNITPTTTAPLDLGTITTATVDLPTNVTTTAITGGTRPNNGTNLFHSFDSFTLGTGDVAHFQNNMQLLTTNIIARVIGPEVSTIDGTLRTNIPGEPGNPLNFGAANLWLVNPSGLLLGPNARVEVGGSVSMSTANYLRFEGQTALFDMLSSPASLGPLDVAPVVAFGFVGSNPGAITVQGSQFSVTEGQSISLVGGNISIESGTPEGGAAQPVQLSAPNGKIQLASAASTGEFDAATLQPLPNAGGTSFTSFGSVSLASGSNINVSGASTVFIKGGQIVLSVNDAVLTTSQTSGPPETISLSPGSSIVTSNSGTDPGANVQLIASSIQMNRASMLSVTTGAGPGGDITANVGTLSLANNATITTRTLGPGRGGDVHITAGNLTIQNVGSGIFTRTLGGDGVGGDLFLNVETLSLLLRGRIQSTNSNVGTDLNGDGVADVFNSAGGNVTIQGISHEPGSSAVSVVLSGGSVIGSLTDESGDGGGISIRAKSLDLLGVGSTINSSTGKFGHGGNIMVSVQKASLSDGATIRSNSTYFGLAAGAGGSVMVQGLDGEGSKADSLKLVDGSGIISETFGTGPLGDIEVHAKTLSLTNEAAIIAGTAGDTAKTSGNVTIKADSVGISGGSRIASQVFAAAGGQVNIKADQLTLENGSIETSTFGVGLGGDVVLNVGSVSLANGAAINSSTFGAGLAGHVKMNVGSLTLTNNAVISSNSGLDASGNAGIVTIEGQGGPGTSATSVTLSNSSLLTNAEGAGAGGDITVSTGSFTLSNGGTVSAASTGSGNAGSITMTASGPILLDSGVISTSAQTTQGGDIMLTSSNSVTLQENALVSASSQGAGNAGNITINAGQQYLSTNSAVTTQAAAASGGDITVNAQEMIRLIDSQINTSVAGGTTTLGGNIIIDPQFVILQNSQIIARAFAGTGGNISITAGVFLADPNSVVDATSQRGISGEVNIQSPVQNVGGRLTPLSQQFSSAAALLAQRCAARVADGKFSTFVVAGREGLPAEPGGFLASPSWKAELFGSNLSGRYPHTPIAAVTALFPEYDARPIQLAKIGDACH